MLVISLGKAEIQVPIRTEIENKQKQQNYIDNRQKNKVSFSLPTCIESYTNYNRTNRCTFVMTKYVYLLT